MMVRIAQLAVVLIGAVACVTDVRARRIPNVLTFGAAALGLIAHALTGGVTGAGTSLAGWLTGLVMFLPFFVLGGMGAGDVKLLAALGAWLGPTNAIWLGMYSAMIGGALALVVALGHGYAKQAFKNLWWLIEYWCLVGVRPLAEVTLEAGRGPRLAYAVPITLGALVTLWLH